MGRNENICRRNGDVAGLLFYFDDAHICDPLLKKITHPFDRTGFHSTLFCNWWNIIRFLFPYSCFPAVGLVVYIAVLAPIGLVLIHNLITFAVVMKGIVRQKPGRVHSRSNQDHKMFVQRCRQSISISCLLGLTWVFGFLAIDTASLTFQWLFCVLNSFQGLLIFVFFCLLQPDVKELFSRLNCKRTENTTASSQTRSDSAGNTRDQDEERDEERLEMITKRP